MCLEAARRDAAHRRGMIRSLLLIEPVSFHLLRTAKYDNEWEKISGIARRCISAAAQGNLRKAANSYMGFWLGPLRWRFAPRRFRAEVIRTIPKVAHEFQAMFDHSLKPPDYSQIEGPVTLVCGGRSPRPASVVVELLKKAIPHAVRVEIRSAGHMSPFTHKQEVSRLIQSHLNRNAPILERAVRSI